MKKHLLIVFTFLALNSFSQIPTNGLVGYWPFNGNANDASGNGHNGQITGATLTDDRFGNLNSAYFFPGNVSNKIIINDDPAFNFTTGFTISAWAKFLQPWTFHVEDIVYKGTFPFNAGWSLSVNQDNSTYGTGNYAALGLLTAGSGAAGTSTYIQAFPFFNDWHHYAYSYDGSINRLYIDGVLVDSIAITNPVLNNSLNIEIGGSLHPVSGAYDRNIDDVSIYNRVLSISEIQQLFTANGTISCQGSSLPSNLMNGLAAWYPFCGNSNDESGNGYNAISNNGQFTADRFGNLNAAVNLNGSSELIALPGASLADNDTFSVAFWTNPNSYSIHTSVEMGTIGVELRWAMDWSLSQMMFWSMTCSGTYGPGINDNTGVQLSNWQHLVYVIEGASVKLYKDGIFISQSINSDTLNCFTNAMNIYFGGDIGGGAIEYYDGSFDDIGLWNRPLDSIEVNQLFNNGLNSISSPESNTISIYPNPATDHLTINLGINLTSNHCIKIIDLLGNEQFYVSTTESKFVIDLNAIGIKGLCFLSVTDKNGKLETIQKVVIR